MFLVFQFPDLSTREIPCQQWIPGQCLKQNIIFFHFSIYVQSCVLGNSVQTNVLRGYASPSCFAMRSLTCSDIFVFLLLVLKFSLSFLSFPLSLVSLSDGFQVRVSTTQYKLAERYNFTSPIFAELETKGIEISISLIAAGHKTLHICLVWDFTFKTLISIRFVGKGVQL